MKANLEFTRNNIREAQKMLEEAAYKLSLAELGDEMRERPDMLGVPRVSLGEAEGIRDWRN